MNDENPETKTPAAPERSEADAAVAREAFFAKVPDPPEKDVVAAQSADDGDEAPARAPKSSTTRASAKATDSAKDGSKERRQQDDDSNDETQKPSSAASASGESAGDLASRVVAALKAGDLDTLADLTDQDPAAFDEKSTKWAARNRKDAKRKEEMAQVQAQAKAIVDHYEPIDTRLEAFQKTRDYAIVAELVELLTGEDFDSVGMKVFRARKGVDPRVPELTRKLAEAEGAVAEARTTKEKAADRALREALRDDLPEDHVVRKLPDWEDRVARVLRDSVDDTGEPALSFKQAANRVVRKEREEYEKRAAVFGGAPSAPAKTRATTPERATPASGAGQRKLTRDEFFASFGK